METIERRYPQGLAITAFLTVSLWGIQKAGPFFIPICLAALLAFLIAPLVRAMHRLHFPEWLAILVSSVLLFLPFIGFASIALWQGRALIQDFPKIMKSLNQVVESAIHSELGQRLNLAQDTNLYGLLGRLEGSLGQGIQFVITGVGAVLDASMQLTLVLFFAILMLASQRHLRKSGERILIRSLGAQDPHVLDLVVTMIEKFLVARLGVVLLVSALAWLILMAFGVNYALLVGSVLGIMTLIPVIGFLVGLIPPILISLGMGFSFVRVVLLILALVLLNILEGNVITPRIVGKRININALCTFIGLFAGGLFWGLWGMFLSIPILGALRIILNAIPTLQPWGELLADQEEVVPLRKKKIA